MREQGMRNAVSEKCSKEEVVSFHLTKKVVVKGLLECLSESTSLFSLPFSESGKVEPKSLSGAGSIMGGKSRTFAGWEIKCCPSRFKLDSFSSFAACASLVTRARALSLPAAERGHPDSVSTAAVAAAAAAAAAASTTRERRRITPTTRRRRRRWLLQSGARPTPA